MVLFGILGILIVVGWLRYEISEIIKKRKTRANYKQK